LRLCFFFFLNCADVENCGSFKGFGFIYIYRFGHLVWKTNEAIHTKHTRIIVGVLIFKKYLIPN